MNSNQKILDNITQVIYRDSDFDLNIAAYILWSKLKNKNVQFVPYTDFFDLVTEIQTHQRMILLVNTDKEKYSLNHLKELSPNLIILDSVKTNKTLTSRVYEICYDEKPMSLFLWYLNNIARYKKQKQYNKIGFTWSSLEPKNWIWDDTGINTRINQIHQIDPNFLKVFNKLNPNFEELAQLEADPNSIKELIEEGKARNVAKEKYIKNAISKSIQIKWKGYTIRMTQSNKYKKSIADQMNSNVDFGLVWHMPTENQTELTFSSIKWDVNTVFTKYLNPDVNKYGFERNIERTLFSFCQYKTNKSYLWNGTIDQFIQIGKAKYNWWKFGTLSGVGFVMGYWYGGRRNRK